MVLIIFLILMILGSSLLIYAIKRPFYQNNKQPKSTAIKEVNTIQSLVTHNVLNTPQEDTPISPQWILNLPQEKEEKLSCSSIKTEHKATLNEASTDLIQDIKTNNASLQLSIASSALDITTEPLTSLNDSQPILDDLSVIDITTEALTPLNDSESILDDLSVIDITTEALTSLNDSLNKAIPLLSYEKKETPDITIASDKLKDSTTQEFNNLQQEWDSWVVPEIDDNRQQMRIEKAPNLSSKIIAINRKKGWAKFSSSGEDQVYYTTLTECTCPDCLKRMKPCKHIYCLALELSLVNGQYKYYQQAYQSSISDSVCTIQNEEHIDLEIKKVWYDNIINILSSFYDFSQSFPYEDNDFPEQIKTYESILRILKKEPERINDKQRKTIYDLVKYQIEGLPYYALKPAWEFDVFNLLRYLNNNYSSTISEVYSVMANNSVWENSYINDNIAGERKRIAKLIVAIIAMKSKTYQSFNYDSNYLFSLAENLKYWISRPYNEYIDIKTVINRVLRFFVPLDSIEDLLPFYLILPPQIKKEFRLLFLPLWCQYASCDNLSISYLFSMVYKNTRDNESMYFNSLHWYMFLVIYKELQDSKYEVFITNTNLVDGIENIPIIIAKNNSNLHSIPLKKLLFSEHTEKFIDGIFYKKATSIIEFVYNTKTIPTQYYIYALTNSPDIIFNYEYHIKLIAVVSSWDVALSEAKKIKQKKYFDRVIISIADYEGFDCSNSLYFCATAWNENPNIMPLVLWDSHYSYYYSNDNKQKKYFSEIIEGKLLNRTTIIPILTKQISNNEYFQSLVPTYKHAQTYFSENLEALFKGDYHIITFELLHMKLKPRIIYSHKIKCTWEEAKSIAISKPNAYKCCRTFIIGFGHNQSYTIWDSNTAIATQNRTIQEILDNLENLYLLDNISKCDFWKQTLPPKKGVQTFFNKHPQTIHNNQFIIKTYEFSNEQHIPNEVFTNKLHCSWDTVKAIASQQPNLTQHCRTFIIGVSQNQLFTLWDSNYYINNQELTVEEIKENLEKKKRTSNSVLVKRDTT